MIEFRVLQELCARSLDARQDKILAVLVLASMKKISRSGVKRFVGNDRTRCLERGRSYQGRDQLHIAASSQILSRSVWWSRPQPQSRQEPFELQ